MPLKDGGHRGCTREALPVAWEGWLGGGETGGRTIHGSGAGGAELGHNSEDRGRQG